MKLLVKGAEGDIFQTNSTILKRRISKGYREPLLDSKIRGMRTKAEAKLIAAASMAGVATPKVLKTSKYDLEIELIKGARIKELMNRRNYKGLAAKIGSSIARLHKHDIIHGDLTTSNMIVKDSRVFFIDFGLGLFSQREEDMATDLHLLKEALESTHFDVSGKAFSEALKAYKKEWDGAEKVLAQLEVVEKRGRYVKRTGK